MDIFEITRTEAGVWHHTKVGSDVSSERCFELAVKLATHLLTKMRATVFHEMSSIRKASPAIKPTNVGQEVAKTMGWWKWANNVYVNPLEAIVRVEKLKRCVTVSQRVFVH